MADQNTTHPLEHEWTFWYDTRPSHSRRVKGEKATYEANLQEVGTFGSVEDFWRYYNHMAKPSRLVVNSNYHIFKKNVKPMWEDSNNANGGKWVIQLKGSGARQLLDPIWENILLALVGESLETEAGNEICGCVCSTRKDADRIALWTRTKQNDKFIKQLGEELKKILQLVHITDKIVMSYQNHSDALRSGASYSNMERFYTVLQ